jgi:murein DD-endopeptidase MepM/ murein hydrolase activator NlpD
VVAISLFTKIRSLAGLVAAATLFGATPAAANASANADIIAPLRAAQASKQQSALGNGDEEFRQLFSSWQSLEKGPALAASSLPNRNVHTIPSFSTIQSVSIPSRMPVESVRLTSEYGMRVHPVLGGRREHKGVDLAAPVGTPIYATADGTVSRADWFSGYGLFVSLEHGGDLQTRYGHMSRLNVAAGQHVHKGDVIGYVGTTGRTTGPHLHYEVRVAGEAVNPLPYMQGTSSLASSHDATAVGGGDEE